MNKRRIRSTTLTDTLVIIVLILINPAGPFAPAPPQVIPDKVELYYQPSVTADSLESARQLTAQEIGEIEYYMRVHNVTDEGYNLVAEYYTQLQQEQKWLANRHPQDSKVTRRRRVKAADRPLTAVKMEGGYWRAGLFHTGPLSGEAIMRDYQGRIISALWDCDTIVVGCRHDSLGIYQGQMDRYGMACGQGTYDGIDGLHRSYPFHAERYYPCYCSKRRYG